MSVVKKRRFKGGGRRFIQLYHNVKRSRAYHGLSVYARCALFELLERYTGINNGMIGLGCRELAEELNCSRDTAAKALRELDDSGLVATSDGGYVARQESHGMAYHVLPMRQDGGASNLELGASLSVRLTGR